MRCKRPDLPITAGAADLGFCAASHLICRAQERGRKRRRQHHDPSFFSVVASWASACWARVELTSRRPANCRRKKQDLVNWASCLPQHQDKVPFGETSASSAKRWDAEGRIGTARGKCDWKVQSTWLAASPGLARSTEWFEIPSTRMVL